MINNCSLKICSKCKEAKELSKFPKSDTCAGGHRPDCKTCVSVYRKQNWDTRKLAMKDTYESRIPESKKCPKCDTIKPSSDFGIKKYQPDGLNTHCKPCVRVEDRKSYNEKKSKGIKRKVTDHAVKYRQEWYVENKERVIKQRAEYRRTPNARAKKNVRKAIRRSLEAAGNPSWLTKQQKEEIQLLYKQAQTMSEFHEERYEVDHIEPLQGKTSCGLTVPWNLRVILGTENRSKSNKLLTELINPINLTN